MTTLTLDSVQQDFEAWRSSRSKKSKIPKPLWDKALQLLEYYPISQVTKALHLSGGQVLAKRKQRLITSPSLALKSPVNFVEFNIPLAAAPSDTGLSTPSKLEIKRADGAILAIEGLTEQALFQVFNQFTGGLR